MLTWSAPQVCEVFTKWLQGLPFRGPKCLQSLLVSTEMLHAQPMSKQLLYLQVPAPCHGCLAWCGEQLCWKAPNLTFLWTAAEANPSRPLVLLSEGTFQPFTCSSTSCGDATFPPSGKLMVCFWFPPVERHPQAEGTEKFNPRWRPQEVLSS